MKSVDRVGVKGSSNKDKEGVSRSKDGSSSNLLQDAPTLKSILKKPVRNVAAKVGVSTSDVTKVPVSSDVTEGVSSMAGASGNVDVHESYPNVLHSNVINSGLQEVETQLNGLDEGNGKGPAGENVSMQATKATKDNAPHSDPNPLNGANVSTVPGKKSNVECVMANDGSLKSDTNVMAGNGSNLNATGSNAATTTGASRDSILKPVSTPKEGFEDPVFGTYFHSHNKDASNVGMGFVPTFTTNSVDVNVEYPSLPTGDGVRVSTNAGRFALKSTTPSSNESSQEQTAAKDATSGSNTMVQSVDVNPPPKSYVGATTGTHSAPNRECVTNMEVADVNSTGLHFTWNQKPKGSNGTLKKIDRIMSNIQFCDTYPGSFAIFQPYRISDHSPCVLRIPHVAMLKPKPFKFSNFLVHKEGFMDTVNSGWNININGCAIDLSPLRDMITPREIVRAGLNLKDSVYDVIENGNWKWPADWLPKYPTLFTLPVPFLHDANDTLVWQQLYKLSSGGYSEVLAFGDCQLIPFGESGISDYFQKKDSGLCLNGPLLVLFLVRVYAAMQFCLKGSEGFWICSLLSTTEEKR
ncbi:RNA-directed DNA polymerase, eukaryota, Reverse transcriptase zinc-binding domain protein [Artemisia annua]|uniref:RNA-directed DNA polymerase, eukaryota, Reverse transcriptase zinc-binding domain protein n=1 Tax=Artemisia annua TaxID=35608 RepID=A0A2U1M8S0_ARTAN|nr:RNA-directed DNA polymerase, eukaryota, Reverse transcriptase zinc-binding domain protein [Artemisia annua]